MTLAPAHSREQKVVKRRTSAKVFYPVSNNPVIPAKAGIPVRKNQSDLNEIGFPPARECRIFEASKSTQSPQATRNPVDIHSPAH